MMKSCSTQCIIIINQVQLFGLRQTRQCVCRHVQWSLIVLNIQQEFSQLFYPPRLPLVVVWVCRNMHVRLMVSIHHCISPINITSPLLTCYKYCKKLTVWNRVVPFLWQVFVRYICNRVQITIIAILH